MSEVSLRDRDRETVGVGEACGLLPILASITSAHPAFEVFRLSQASASALKSLARSMTASAEIVVLAAIKTLLHRYASEDNTAILCFADTSETATFGEASPRGIVVSLQPSSGMSFRSYLAQIRDIVHGALDAGADPVPRHGEEFLAKGGIDRDSFQALISVSLPVGPCTGGGDLRLPDMTAVPGRVDLHLALDDQSDGLFGRLLYDDARFDAANIARIAGHLVTLFGGIAVDPDCPLDTLPLLTRDEALRMTVEWNSTCRAVPYLPLHRRFEVQVSQTPDAPALHFNDATLSYDDLDRRADQLARRLAAAGAGSGTLVAVCLERSPDLVAGLLAVLKTGAAYLPLDPGFPPARLAMITEDAQPLVFLTQRSLLPMLPETAARMVLCDDDASGAPADGIPSIPGIPAFPGNLETPAYVLYTSGSTGRPKGVEVPHRAIVNLLSSMQADPGFGADDALLAVTTIAFDIATLELFLPLVSGGRVILASREAAGDPLQLLDLMNRSRCTIMQATPATWRGLIAAGWQGDPGLRILCGGESMSRDLAQKLRARCAALWNMYGPTETTVWSTMHKVEAVDHGTVAIGRPIGNTTTTILDQFGGVVPVGVPGELHIGGNGVATGYWRNPALTRERFVASPYAPAERLYRTGDIARYRSDGVIEWLGRADGQVKIRGFRIETQEIEAALEQHADVAGAAVRTWPDESGQPSLAAYVVAAGGDALDVAVLRLFLRRTLPEYMIPTRYVFLAALPLTPNGKIDRKALPEPPPPERSGTIAAAGDRARRLAPIWERLLKVTNLSEHDEFFELGGDSILAVSLLLSIEAEFGRRLTMAALFEAPTIARMAALLDASQDAALPLVAEIQPSGSRPSLFWIDGGPMFLPLANALGTERPFLGVTLHPPELREVGFQPDLQTIARHLVRTITTIQAEGPYVIGGYCAGGVLAYEVASQLMASGQRVDLLCMIDAQNPTHFRRVDSFSAEFAKLRHHLAGIWRAGKTSRLDYVALHLKSAYRRILSRSAWRPVMKSDPFTLGEIMQPAVAAYRPGRYAGRVALFQAKRPKPLDLRPGWAETVTGELIALNFSGTHQTMLEQPQVQKLASLMNGCLDRIEDSGSLGPVKGF